ncbi:MAG: ArsB/NhaD family transporter [bacterium]
MEHSSLIFGMNKAIIAGLILFFTYIFIAAEKIPKVTTVMLGASLTLVLGILPADKAFAYIDFGVITLLVSMMMIVHITSKSGVFTWFAVKLLKFTKGNPVYVLISLSVLTAFLSTFLNNVTTVILLIPITFVIAKELNADPIPFLITEIIASNIGGTATLIGDPPNIIIGSAAALTFNDFLKELTPVVILIFIVSTAVLVYLFRKDLINKPELANYIANLDDKNLIKDKQLMIKSLFVLLLTIIGFIFCGNFHLEAYMISLLGASVLLLFDSPKKIIHEVEWLTIFFFIGLFIIIGGVESTGGIHFLSQKLLKLTQGDLKLTAMIILWGSGFLSAIIDNIPYTITMVPLVQELHNVMNIYPLWWALSLGACLGGNATIIGAAANVVVSEASYEEGHPISFFRFMKYGLLITIISLAISSIYIYFRFLA